MAYAYESEFISCNFDDNRLSFVGEMRYPRLGDYKQIRKYLWDSIIKNVGTRSPLIIDIKGLSYLNSSGQAVLNMFILEIKRTTKGMNIQIFGDGEFEWQHKFLYTFQQLWKDKEESLEVFIDNQKCESVTTISNIKGWKK